MLEMLGYLTVYRDGLKDLGFGVEEADAIARGIKKALEITEWILTIKNGWVNSKNLLKKRLKRLSLFVKKNKTAQLEENIKKGKDFIDGLSNR